MTAVRTQDEAYEHWLEEMRWMISQTAIMNFYSGMLHSNALSADTKHELAQYFLHHWSPKHD